MEASTPDLEKALFVCLTAGYWTHITLRKTNIAGWNLDPDWRSISYWKWGHSSQLCDRLPEGKFHIKCHIIMQKQGLINHIQKTAWKKQSDVV